jgi:3-deoxy-D-arabino-heptulosonate 7-phosphate (DAHP) synthase
LDEARQQLGLMVVTEAVDPESLKHGPEWEDMVQIGAQYTKF